MKPEGGTELDRHRAAPLAGHLEAYRASKLSAGCTGKHTNDVLVRLAKVSHELPRRTLGDIRGDGVEQYLPPALAAELAAYANTLPPGAALFGALNNESSADLLRDDLKVARQSWLADAGPSASERPARESSHFLLPNDPDGRRMDFHGLRHTCGAWAASNAAGPKAVQTRMRHASISLTFDTYGHLMPDEA
ncbi:MAG: tyrosine-type recombinase/integrase, partial [Planctomycetota bacterium]